MYVRAEKQKYECENTIKGNFQAKPFFEFALDSLVKFYLFSKYSIL